MKNLIIILAVISSSLLVSCASIHPGFKGHSVEPGNPIDITVSAENLDYSKRDSFQLIEVTIENNTTEWIRIESIRPRLPDPAESKVSAVLGQDLVDWAEAKQAQAKVDKLNQDIIQASLVGAGVLASTSKNSALSSLGTVATVGGLGWAAATGISGDKRQAEAVMKVPSTHLYAPVAVPAKMFQRRWLLLNKPPNAELTTLVIDVTTVDGKRGMYEIPLSNH